MNIKNLLGKPLNHYYYWNMASDKLSNTDLPKIPQETLDKLNQYISTLGYTFMKQKAKEDYGMKYVWTK